MPPRPSAPLVTARLPLQLNRTAQTAIAAASRLAEVYDGGRTKLSSHDIAAVRQIAQPIVAKVLSYLSAAGLVAGVRGPGGGYWLARAPEHITLATIAKVVDGEEMPLLCPFGPHWCGRGPVCPLHDSLSELSARWQDYLEGTSLAVFCRAA